MDIKKIGVQVLVAMVLFVGIALIIEGVYTQEMVLSKLKSAAIFGVLYAIYIVVKNKVRGKKE